MQPANAKPTYEQRTAMEEGNNHPDRPSRRDKKSRMKLPIDQLPIGQEKNKNYQPGLIATPMATWDTPARLASHPMSLTDSTTMSREHVDHPETSLDMNGVPLLVM